MAKNVFVIIFCLVMAGCSIDVDMFEKQHLEPTLYIHKAEEVPQEYFSITEREFVVCVEGVEEKVKLTKGQQRVLWEIMMRKYEMQQQKWDHPKVTNPTL